MLRGLGAVGEAGLVYDLLVRSRELPAAHRAVEQLPQLSFVVDHAAKPAIRAGAWEPWSTRIAAMAALPNVTCKLSGLVTEAAYPSWTVDHLAPYVARLVDLFGPARLLFGSDWPVCELAGEYVDVYAAVRELVAFLSESDRAQIFGETAISFYGLRQ